MKLLSLDDLARLIETHCDVRFTDDTVVDAATGVEISETEFNRRRDAAEAQLGCRLQDLLDPVAELPSGAN